LTDLPDEAIVPDPARRPPPGHLLQDRFVINRSLTIPASTVVRVRPAPAFAVWMADALVTVDTTSSGAGLRA
jgi:hypothetical protein